MKSVIQWARDIAYIAKAFIQYMLPIKIQQFKTWIMYRLKKIVGRV